MRIRAATDDDIEALREVERAAGICFRDVGMSEIADDEPPGAEVLAGFIADGRAWVAVDEWTDESADGPEQRVVAYLVADVVDGTLHVEQVSVHPDASHRGIGRALIEHAAAWAAGRGMPALTLTTFVDVPWNAPYYERCGFRRIGEGELTPGLVAVRRREAAHGLDRWPRVAMRREIPAPHHPV